MTPGEVRHAYSELRQQFNRKVRRIEAAGFKREITSETFKPVASFTSDEDLAQELRELAYYSRKTEYSMREMERRITGLMRWMADNDYKNPSRETAKNFARFLEALRDSGVTMSTDQNKYMNVADATLQAFKRKETAQIALQNFDQWVELTAAGVPDVPEAIKSGEIYGMDIRTAMRHTEAIKKYSTELRELSNESTFRKPRTDQEVDNLLRRARRRSRRQ